MIVYHVVMFHHAGTLTDYDILSTHDSLSLATAALRRMTGPRVAIVGPAPRDEA